MDRELVERAKHGDRGAYEAIGRWSPDGQRLMMAGCRGAMCDRLVELDPFGSDPPVYLEVPGGALDGLSWGPQR